MLDFYSDPKKGIAGQLANMTMCSIDSMPAGGNIKAGAVLKLNTDNETVVALDKAADIAKGCGIALFSQKEVNENGYSYVDGDVVPVLTYGDVFMNVEAAAVKGYTCTVADGTDTVLLTPVAVGTANEYTKIKCDETASNSDVVMMHVDFK